jgi:hypothetical protein
MEAILAKATMRAQHPIPSEVLQQYKDSIKRGDLSPDNSLDEQYFNDHYNKIKMEPSSHEMKEMYKVGAS